MKFPVYCEKIPPQQVTFLEKKENRQTAVYERGLEKSTWHSVQDCKIKLVWKMEAGISSSSSKLLFCCCCRVLMEDERPSGGLSRPADMPFFSCLSSVVVFVNRSGDMCDRWSRRFNKKKKNYHRGKIKWDCYDPLFFLVPSWCLCVSLWPSCT